ncbi:gluconeogenesis factor YvcK family protein [Propionigenium maris]|nr:YvcK family protein [Propionigenium maris]
MYIKPKVVVLGGGTGLSVILRGLKHFPVDITAIVTVADDGGSSGKLRDELEIPAPGDLRNVMVALSEIEPLVEDLLQYRFKGDTSLAGHPLGNLLLAAMVGVTGDLTSAMKGLTNVFDIKGRILPSTCDKAVLVAEMVDGTRVEGESKIPKADKKIKRVYFKESPEPVEETITAVEEADLIVLGIGSLYTSIIPNLLPGRMRRAILNSRAKKVYICNAMEQPGETRGYTLSDHIQALHNHMGRKFLDVVVADISHIPEETLELYRAEGVGPVKVDRERCEEMNLELMEQRLIELEKDTGKIRHHPYKTAAAVYSLIEH